MLINPQYGQKMITFKNDKMNFPITRLVWQHIYMYKPEFEEQVLYGSCVDGNIVRWSQKDPEKIQHLMLNSKNQYNSIDIGGDDKHIAVAGKLKQIELWDLNKMVMDQCWTKEDKNCHDNSVFTARFFPFNQFNLYSGGWDRTIKFWDVRHGHITSFAHGTQTCSDSIDMEVSGHLVVTGGGTHGEGIQIWDIRNLEGPVFKLTFSPGEVRNPMIEPFINCCRFIPRTKHILVAATDAQFPAKIFNYQTGELIDKFFN